MSTETDANTTPSAGQVPDAGTSGQESGDGERVDAEYVRQLRAENAKHRRDAKALEARVAQFESEKLTEGEKLQKQLGELTAERDRLANEVRQSRAQGALAAAGAIYPELVAAKLPPEALDDAKALNAAVADLKRSYPTLFRATAGSADGAAGQSSGTVVDMNAAIRRAAGRA